MSLSSMKPGTYKLCLKPRDGEWTESGISVTTQTQVSSLSIHGILEIVATIPMRAGAIHCFGIRIMSTPPSICNIHNFLRFIFISVYTGAQVLLCKNFDCSEAFTAPASDHRMVTCSKQSSYLYCFTVAFLFPVCVALLSILFYDNMITYGLHVLIPCMTGFIHT